MWVPGSLLSSVLVAGVDPKSLLCEYHKAGQCTKGFKCKFSHDLNIGRKTQKIDLFSDKCAPSSPSAQMFPLIRVWRFSASSGSHPVPHAAAAVLPTCLQYHGLRSLQQTASLAHMSDQLRQHDPQVQQQAG